MSSKIKTPSENILSVLKGKKVLFLENDNSLHHGIDCFEERLKENKIKYKILFDLSNIPIDEILNLIHEYDCIVFMTQWVYPISHKLKSYMLSLKEKKIVIEVYLKEPTWFYKPDGIKHDVYVYSCLRFSKSDPIEYEKFYKLRKHIPYWDYKNKFDN